MTVRFLHTAGIHLGKTCRTSSDEAWQTSKHKTCMLPAYAKARKETLEPEQVVILKALVKGSERHG